MTRDDPAAFAPPPAFGPFRVLHQIGVGALGPVVRTYEPTRDRLVAVKVFRLDITPEQSQALADELSHAAEAGLFHPSIVEPIAAGVQGTLAYRAEEYVAAETLDIAIRHYAPAALDKALPFITQLAGAIDFARAAGIGHGALHLRDIFVTPDEARASGFGVVEALERIGMRAPVRRPYSAPERIAGEEWGAAADIFSLAAIAYELLTGRRPSGTGEQMGPLTGDNLGAHAEGMRAVLARAMDEDPARRYPTALAFASALEAASRGDHVTDAVRVVGAIAAADRPRAAEPAVPPPPAPVPVVAAAREHVAPVARATDHDDAEEVDIGDALSIEAADEDDVVMERDEDHAHYDFARQESAGAGGAPSLFDDEAAADRALDEPPARFADEFALSAVDGPHERDVHDLLRPAVEQEPVADIGPDRKSHAAIFEERHDYRRSHTILREPEYTAGEFDGAGGAERRWTAMPIAVGIVIGLLAGLAGGYGLWARGSSATPATDAGARVEVPPAAAPVQGTAGKPAEQGKAYSEQAVAQPPGTPPGIPSDAPAPSGRPPAPAAPAAVATTGRIVVQSTPSRAGVTLDGRWRGRTPLTLDGLKLGAYDVKVVQPGFGASTEHVTLSRAEPSRTVSFKLRPSNAAAAARQSPAPSPRTQPPPFGALAGTVYVDSRPRGARILLDGKPVGTTPARLADVPVGNHVIRLELADHREWTNNARVAAGQETRVTGSLEPIR